MGQHVLALGNGVMGSWLANVARNAGRTLAERRAGVAATPATVAPPAGPAIPPPVVVMQGAPQLPAPSFIDVGLAPPREVVLTPEPFAGPHREVLLTPEPTTEGDDAPKRRRDAPSRFVRAARADDDHTD